MVMTEAMKRALEMHSVVPSTARDRSARVDYVTKIDFFRDAVDDSQREHYQRAMGLNLNLVIGESREDFKY